MSLSNWEDTLNQLYLNYMKQCKKIAKEMLKLKHMEITIQTFELRIKKDSDEWKRTHG